MDAFQKCPSCGITKTIGEFNKGARPNGASSYCTECSYIKHVCRTYKISKEVYLLLVERANGRCECCGRTPKRLVIDHDHTTDGVRGLICDTCNHFIGMIETQPSLPFQAREYLARSLKDFQNEP